MNLLFVCSRNQWRSPTAEQVWARTPKVNVRSAGTSPRARRTINMQDVRWADLILVMEHKHSQQVRAEFGNWVRKEAIVVLDIPDDYRFMDPELVSLLSDQVATILNSYGIPVTSAHQK